MTIGPERLVDHIQAHLGGWLPTRARMAGLARRPGRPRASRGGPDTDRPAVWGPDAEVRQDIAQAVAWLPALYGQALVLAEIDGLPPAAVGRALGRSEGAALDCIQRARTLLADGLEAFACARARDGTDN